MDHPSKWRPDIRAFKRLAKTRRHILRLLSLFRISENGFMAIIAVVIGVLAGLSNYAFRTCISFFHWLIVESTTPLTGYAPTDWGWQRLWAVVFPLAGALLMLPLFHFFRDDLSFGFPCFLEAVNLRGGKLRWRLILTRGISSALTIGSGGSAGQEGPIAQIGGTAGSFIGQFLGTSGERLKVLIGCGVSGGVAATFNAPLAGVFFAHEIVLLSSFELSSFTSIVISSGMATIVSRALFGNMPAFDVPAYQLLHPVELLFYASLGIACGGIAVLFIGCYRKVRTLFTALAIPPLLKPCLGAILAGCIGVALPQVQGNGYHFIEQVVGNDAAWLLVTALIAGKLVATAVTIGSGLPGGTFAPSLFIGAVTGSSFGYLLNQLFPASCSTPGAYALVGMGAFLAAVAHAPMTGIFLLFEMTGSYQIIVPIMIACVIGTAIARHFKKDGIDTVDLAAEGITLRVGKEQSLLETLTVRDAMSTAPELLSESMTIRQFSDHVTKSRQSSFPLVDLHGKLTGIVSLQDLLGVAFEEGMRDQLPLKELATEEVVTVTGDESLAEALRMIDYCDFEQLPVVDRRGGTTVIGILSRRDITGTYERAVMGRALTS
ncbi:chloride channel protein [Geobacter pickeringii]|uniref:Chloride channel protein n=1 Tax=Geobacter pickeringii TaxID=345632 RepID=A0A0B5BHI1_9BACT|nr:chloride channel protein [Geobacter pickeringii]AJE03930.1 chloride channel protein [Geobacter pickeringii]